MQTLSLPPQRFAAHDANAVTYCNFKVYHIRDAQRERETDRQTDRMSAKSARGAWRQRCVLYLVRRVPDFHILKERK